MPEPRFIIQAMEVMAYTFIFVVGSVLLAIVMMYILDVTQTRQVIHRNYHVIGRFRYLFENMGNFFRQYFFVMDREKLPFNRAERSWGYRAAKNLSNMAAYGFTRDRDCAVRELPHFHTRRGRHACRCRYHRTTVRASLHHLAAVQHLRHELRRDLQTGSSGPVKWWGHGGLLYGYR